MHIDIGVRINRNVIKAKFITNIIVSNYSKTIVVWTKFRVAFEKNFV